jgi:hypothetical protein
MGVQEDGVAIAGALLKVQREIEELADQVLPPLSDEQQERVEKARRGPRSATIRKGADWSVADTLD